MSDSKVTVLSATGIPQEVPQSELASYLDAGFVPDTPAAAAARAKQAKYETTGQQIATIGEGVLRGGTMGLSDFAETGLGISSASDIAARRAANPTEAGISEQAGLLGAMLLPGIAEAKGATTAASVATAPVRGVSAAGEFGGSLVKRILGGLGAAPEGLLTKTASSAANMAIQSELFNIAKNIDETHLQGGNLKQAAENALAGSGDALALGASLGAALPIAGFAVKKAAASASSALGGLASFVSDRLPDLGESAAGAYAKVASPLSGLSEDAIKEQLAQPFTEEGAAMRERLLHGITADERNAMQTEFQTALQKSLSETQDAIAKGWKELRPEETAKLAAQSQLQPAAEDAIKIIRQINDTAMAMRAEPEIYSGAVARKLEMVAQGAQNKFVDQGIDDAAQLFQMMNDMKSKALDPLAKFGGAVSMPERDAIAKVRELRSVVKNHLENESLYGEAAARQAAFNDAYNQWQTLVGKKGTFGKTFLENVPTRSGGEAARISQTKVNSFFNKLGSARAETQTLALNDFLDSSDKLISQLQKSAANIQSNAIDEQGLKSLIQTVRDSHATSAPQLEQAARQRALANGPFVTSSPLSIVHEHGGLATAGAIIGGAPGAVAGALANKALGIMTNPQETVRALSVLEGLAMKTSKRISSGVKAALSTGAELADVAAPYARTMAAYDIEEHEHAKAYQKELHDRMQATDYQANIQAKSPQAMQYAPNVSKAIASKQQALDNFLAQKLPKNPSVLPQIGKPTWAPSRGEWQDYLETRRLAKKPLTAIDKLEAGILTQDDVALLQTLWPSVLDQMRTSAAEHLMKSTNTLNSRQLEQLEILFGHPIEDSQLPDFQQIIQQTWDSEKQKKAQQQQSMPNLSDVLSKQFMTKSQKLANA